MAGPAGPSRTDGGTDRSTLFEHTPDPLLQYATNGEPTVRAVNPAFEAAFGLDAASVVGEPVVQAVPGDAAALDDLLNGMRDGEARAGELWHEASSGTRHFLARSVPVPDAADAAGYLLLTDITELRNRIHDLQVKAKRFEESTHVIAHDIRNPLEVAEINLEVAMETGDQELLEEVAEAHDQIERLIEDVLTLAAKGQVIESREPVELETVLDRAWSNVATGEASLTFEEPLVVEADADRLQQLLENLVRNAIEHGGQAATVTVGALGDGEGFYVEDDGPGIPEDERARVFEQGYSGAEGGSGLGLAIVTRIADAHGWDVRVTSGNAGGARFEFLVAAEPAG